MRMTKRACDVVPNEVMYHWGDRVVVKESKPYPHNLRKWQMIFQARPGWSNTVYFFDREEPVEVESG